MVASAARRSGRFVAALLAVAVFASGGARAEGELREPSAGIELVPVKGGCYPMGDAFGDGDRDEAPVHEVCVSDFRMGRTEVTVGQFRRFVEATGYRTDAEKGGGCRDWNGSRLRNLPSMNWRNASFDGRGQDERHPVVCVSHDDARAFAEWLSKGAGKPFRLPTEAEWEYAARDGGRKAKYAWGDGEPSGNVADESVKRLYGKQFRSCWDGYDDGHVFTAPAGSFRPNRLGLHDLTGNVWEWCSDWYGETYYGESPREDPPGPPSGSKRVARGGSWIGGPSSVRASDRGFSTPDDRNTFIGFRVVLPAGD